MNVRATVRRNLHHHGTGGRAGIRGPLIRRTMAVLTVVFTCAVPASTAPLAAQQKQELSSIMDALRASSVLRGRSGPASVNWIDEGDRFSYTQTDPASGRKQIRIYDPATGEDALLLDAGTLTLPGTDEPLEFSSFQWSADSEHLIFQTNFRPIYRHSGIADYYMYSRAGGQLRLVADDARTAELSPDGRLLGYERGGDIYVYDLAADEERRLTSSERELIFNGHFDWVYEEEFGLTQAWNWSPDSRRIAFWQTDERSVPTIQITDYSSQYPDYVEIHYPKVGEQNPEVRIGVVDVRTGEKVWLDTGLEGEFYIPRIYWTSDPNTLAVVTLNRPQDHLRLFFFDVRTGERRLVMEESSEAWIDVFDFFAGINHFFYFPEGMDQFFWISDRSGYQHIYRYDYSGELVNQVTTGDWVVTRVEGIDPESRTLYYTSTEETPLERHLYSIAFDGTGKRRLTREAGTHSIDLSPNGEWYIDRWSNTRQPLQVTLWSADGEMMATLEDNARTEAWLDTHAYSPVEIFQFTTSDGVTLDASMIRPPDFDPSRAYPVIVSIYGGPGSQQVYNRFATSGWEQYLAQHGYIVVGLNNRGSGNYGRDFKEIVYKQLGRWESRDFAEVARYMAALPYVDGDRMAIHGTSYGGYMTISTLLRYPDVFALGVANSPVTDWRLYDTIYTERYMGLLDVNEDGYDSSSTFTYADQLDGHLLLIHSGMDENVHPQNSMQLLTHLTNAGKDVELRFYPPGEHGAAYNPASYVTMLEVYANEFCDWLKPRCAPMDLNTASAASS